MGADPAGTFRGGGSMKDLILCIAMGLVFGFVFGSLGAWIMTEVFGPDYNDTRPIIITCDEPGIHDLRTGYSESLMVICP